MKPTMDALGRQFESTLIRIALKHMHGRESDAAMRLGIGRNPITRKIREFGIDGSSGDEGGNQRRSGWRRCTGWIRAAYLDFLHQEFPIDANQSAVQSTELPDPKNL